VGLIVATEPTVSAPVLEALSLTHLSAVSQEVVVVGDMNASFEVDVPTPVLLLVELLARPEDVVLLKTISLAHHIPLSRWPC
jgi:hypothetical protein